MPKKEEQQLHAKNKLKIRLHVKSMQIYSFKHAYFSEFPIFFNWAFSDFKNEKNSLKHISLELY